MYSTTFPRKQSIANALGAGWLLVVITLSFFLYSCDEATLSTGSSLEDQFVDFTEEIVNDVVVATTAPGVVIEPQKNYQFVLGKIGIQSLFTPATSTSTSSESFSKEAVEKYVKAIQKNNEIGQTAKKIKDGELESTSDSSWDKDAIYPAPGYIVTFTEGSKQGEFVNAWWTKGQAPNFFPNFSNPWKLIKRTDTGDKIDVWDKRSQYPREYIVKHEIKGDMHCFKAKWWNKNRTPTLMSDDDKNPSWKTPWKKIDSCPQEQNSPALGKTLLERVGGGKSPIETPPIREIREDENNETSLQAETPVIPPVIARNGAANGVVTRKPAPEPITLSGNGLPSSGYGFLRALNSDDWDWMFPLRSGKFNTFGLHRNKPPIALQDGSKDVHTLANFKKAVLIYNAWAITHNYKQFLNEGTQKQQGQEFVAFWARAARETSGSWSGATLPWITHQTKIVNNKEQTVAIWKGALYWIEEVGYAADSTFDTTSDTISYVDYDSSYTPVKGQSYHGRGIIQLSWNHNYGAFSAWLYENSLLPDVITEHDTLLTNPDLVLTDVRLSMLSGIWFWMTPQGAKPSSHDVLYGDVYTLSKNTNEQGLPPSRLQNFKPPTAEGDTVDESIMAFRLGTITNIVNGGLECNGQATWHLGAMQRISYYNAYAMYFNDRYSTNITLVQKAINVWTQHPTSTSENDLKSGSCYNQKAYYSW